MIITGDSISIIHDCAISGCNVHCGCNNLTRQCQPVSMSSLYTVLIIEDL